MNSPDETCHHASPALPLAELARGELALVSGLSPVVGLAKDHAEALLARLRDLGFVSGAKCEVVARMWPGGDPLAVRVGGSTFALRRIEADAIRVTRLAPQSVSRPTLPIEDRGAATA